MTVIAAAVRNNRAAIGCDSQVSGAGSKDRILPSKLIPVTVNNKTIGYLGVAGAAVAFEYIKEVQQPATASDEDWFNYLVSLASMLRDKFGGNPFGGARILACNKTSIFDVVDAGVFQVSGRGSHIIAAIGSGGPIALGSMETMTNTLLPWRPASVVRKALQAAVGRAEGCGEPLTVHNL